MADTAQRLTGPLVSRMIAGWKDRRGTTLDLIRHGRGESEALFFAMAAGFMAFVSGIPAAVHGNMIAGNEPDVRGIITTWMLTCLVFMVLARYILSMLSRWGAKALGGTGSHLGARYAQFWAALVVSPLLFAPGAVHLVALTLRSEMLYDIAWGMGLGAQLVFLIFWADALAASEGFESRWKAVAAIFFPLILLGLSAWTVALTFG